MSGGLDVHSVDGAVRPVVPIAPQLLVSDPPRTDDKDRASEREDPSTPSSELTKEPAKEPAKATAEEPKGEAAQAVAKDPRLEGPLASAWTALERGYHVEAASLARKLAESEDEVVRRDAEAFLARLRPDPVILMVFAATGLLLLLLAWQYLGRPR